MNMEMYAEQILDYYKNPRNFGRIESPDFSATEANPLCGDVVEIQIKLKGSGIGRCMFSGSGCAISQAAASMLTEFLSGKNVEEAKKVGREKILELLGVEVGPVRIKCALLCMVALKSALGGRK